MKTLGLKILLLIYLLCLTHETVLIAPCSFPFSNMESFSPTHYQGGILFISPGEDQDDENQISGLYYSQFIEEGVLAEPIKIDTDPSAAGLHLGSGDFCEPSGEFYFTANATLNARGDRAHAAIYKARLDNYQLTGIQLLTINDPEFDYGHPVLSSDGLTMIITTNREGNFDLYEYSRENWDAPWQMKSRIAELASPYHEVSPCLLNDSTLVFSSGRENGLGGLDLYCSKQVEGKWCTPRHLKDLNSEKDDFGYLELTANSGLFSSNRFARSG